MGRTALRKFGYQSWQVSVCAPKKAQHYSQKHINYAELNTCVCVCESVCACGRGDMRDALY